MIISKSFTEIQYKGTLQEIVEATIARKLVPGEKVYMESFESYTHNESLIKITVVQTHVDNETSPTQ